MTWISTVAADSHLRKQSNEIPSSFTILHSLPSSPNLTAALLTPSLYTVPPPIFMLFSTGILNRTNSSVTLYIICNPIETPYPPIQPGRHGLYFCTRVCVKSSPARWPLMESTSWILRLKPWAPIMGPLSWDPHIPAIYLICTLKGPWNPPKQPAHTSSQ